MLRSDMTCSSFSQLQMASRPCARLWVTGKGKTLICIKVVGSMTSDRWAQEVLCTHHPRGMEA